MRTPRLGKVTMNARIDNVATKNEPLPITHKAHVMKSSIIIHSSRTEARSRHFL